MPRRHVFSLRHWAPVLAIVTALAAVGHAQPPSAAVREYDAKAGFLTAFTKYAAWPPDTFDSPASPIVIGVLGNDPFGDVLNTTAALTRGDRPLLVRRIRSLADAGKCQVVFISKSENRNEEAWLAALRDKPVLTVGESGRTLDRGGIIEFTTTRDQVRFDVSLPATQRAGVRLSSDLLSHAGRVRQ